MHRIRRGFVLILLIPSHALAQEADYPDDVSKWVATAPPKLGTRRHFRANQDAAHRWVVFLRGGHPLVRLREKGSIYRRQESLPRMPFKVEQGSVKEGLAGEWFSTKVPDGWIIGFNAGEFGAGLWWYSPDGKRRYKISRDQVVGFLETEAGLLALEGIAHGFDSLGRIVRLTRGSDGRWRSEDLVDLKGAPEVAVKDGDGSVVVATSDRLLRVDPTTRKVDILLENAFWRGLYPASMIIAPTGEVYIGMRHGIAKVERQGTAYKTQWLLPNRKIAEQEPREAE
jgi:hypothetical protein